MKLLLDENVDYDFKFLLPEYDARHVDDFGWKGLTNGKLLDTAEAHDIDVVVTADKNLQFQQNIARRKTSKCWWSIAWRNSMRIKDANL